LKFTVQEVRRGVFQVKKKTKWKEKGFIFTSEVKQVRSEGLIVVCRKLIIREQELYFRKGKLINQNSVILVNWFSIQASTFFSFPISSLSHMSPKSNIFQYIDQREEYVGQWSPSSSEDG
jgi:hypothetical protein